HSLAIGFFLINTRRATEARAIPIPIFKVTKHLQLLRKVHRHVRHRALHHARHRPHGFQQKQQRDHRDRHVLVDVPLPNHQNN
uniref:Uncharacterized protein n=1 Tax=Glossina palpalis gambiensis TaxID=67801 RepID=A0A1B0BN63_9MUSC